MLTKRFLAILLMLLVGAQSFAAGADAHASHQDGVEHLEFDHDHADNPESDENLPNLSSLPITPDTSSQLPSGLQDLDCHHCCHCHGHSSPMLASTLEDLDRDAGLTPNAGFQSELPNPHPTSLYRPPIA